MLVAVVLYNFVDLLLTYYFVILTGTPEMELNPAMRFLIELHPAAFVFVKISVCFGTVYLFWKTLPSVFAKIGTIASFAIYGLLFLYYMIGVGYSIVRGLFG